nr:MAG TPA: hypothetical protein [Caudoviricetes sp.]
MTVRSIESPLGRGYRKPLAPLQMQESFVWIKLLQPEY